MAQTTLHQIAEQQRLTTESVMAGYAALDADGVMRHRSKDCVHKILPQSMGIPPRGNVQYEAFFTRVLQPALRSFKILDSFIVNDPVNHALSLHMTATSDSVVGRYDNEYFFHVKFNESGKEITSIEEMVDSKLSVAFFAKLQSTAKAAAGSMDESLAQKQKGQARL